MNSEFKTFSSSLSDCGKQERERVGSSGVGHSTGAESSILKVRLIFKIAGRNIISNFKIEYLSGFLKQIPNRFKGTHQNLDHKYLLLYLV